MATAITVPRLGWSMDEGTFVGWLKRDGEAVRPGEPLFSLESDKATEQVEAIGRCSIEVGVQVFAENLTSGQRTMTLNSHLVFVKVDEQLKPTPVPTAIAPKGADEEALVFSIKTSASKNPSRV